MTTANDIFAEFLAGQPNAAPIGFITAGLNRIWKDQKELSDSETNELRNKLIQDGPQILAEILEKGTAALGDHPISERERVALGKSLASYEMMQHEPKVVGHRPVTREYLHKLAMFWYPGCSFKEHPNFETIEDAGAIYEQLVTFARSIDPILETSLATEEGCMTSLAVARWAHNAFPTLRLASHRYAAALMSTAVPKHIDIEAPWDSFVIEVPSGLIQITDKDDVSLVDITLIQVLRTPILPYTAEGNLSGDCVPGWTTIAYTSGSVTLHRMRQGLDMMTDDDDHPDANYTGLFQNAFGIEMDDRDNRAHRLITRLVMNSCLAFKNSDEVKQVGKHPKDWSKGPQRGTKEPTVRIFKIGTPIVLDCRPALNEYLAGNKKKTATVQWLVRGHWRNQVHGVGRAGRRLKWIQPYWKGNEEAPILVRPNVLGTDFTQRDNHNKDAAE